MCRARGRKGRERGEGEREGGRKQEKGRRQREIRDGGRKGISETKDVTIVYRNLRG